MARFRHYGADLVLGEGELRAVLGPNGAGKSSILKAIAEQSWLSPPAPSIHRSTRLESSSGRTVSGSSALPGSRKGEKYS